MKTLIVNGSPHKNGETMSMINYVKNRLEGECRLVNTYYDNIAPCIDCRECTSSYGCVIRDDMTQLYDYIIACDRVIFASPLYFSQYTGSFLGFMSRIQMLCAQRYIRHVPVEIKQKRGLVLLNGGGSTVSTAGVEQCTRILMREFNCDNYKTICYIGTDKKSVLEDEKTISALNEGIDFFNKREEPI
jgi:multimeric flavodoxin WrbA